MYYNNYYQQDNLVKKLSDLRIKNNNLYQNQDDKEKKTRKFFTQDGNITIASYNPYDNYNQYSGNIPSQNRLLPYYNNSSSSYENNYNEKKLYKKKLEEEYNKYNLNNQSMHINKEYDLRELNDIISSKIGLKNLGNTCYMNTCLQILIHSKEFIKRILSKKSYINEKTTPITKQFLNLCEKMIYSKERIDPSEFKNIIKEKHSIIKGQFDTQEFCRILLEDINNELNEKRYKTNVYEELSTEGKNKIDCDAEFDELFRKRESSIIIDTFYSQIINIIKCKRKKKEENYSFEKILDLPLLFPEEDNDIISLKDLINNYFLEEELIFSKNSKCKYCGRRTHIKQIKISRPPDILILSLQRINYRTQKKNKCKVEFKETLNLQNYIDEDCGHNNEYIYDLYAIGCHAGDINFGHYFAYIKLNDQDWYEFNDSKVNYIGDNYYTKSTLSYVYVLFYKKNHKINY